MQRWSIYIVDNMNLIWERAKEGLEEPFHLPHVRRGILTAS